MEYEILPQDCVADEEFTLSHYNEETLLQCTRIMATLFKFPNSRPGDENRDYPTPKITPVSDRYGWLSKLWVPFWVP